MVASETTGVAKKKRPPTFQHFPPNRARKLKRTWVDTKKLKGKWKAEKRKEGLASGPNMIKQGVREGEAETFDHLSKAGNETDEGPAITISQTSSRPHRTDISRTSQSQASDPNEKSLRDLTKEAYSWTSLHNYKSNPLNGGRGRGRGCGKSSRRVLRGGRGHGQPNMKLRMGAILEKIKRDYA